MVPSSIGKDMRFSSSKAWVQLPAGSPIEVLYTDLLFQLPLMNQTRSNTDGFSMWLAAKDLLKINEGEVKEIQLVPLN